MRFSSALPFSHKLRGAKIGLRAKLGGRSRAQPPRCTRAAWRRFSSLFLCRAQQVSAGEEIDAGTLAGEVSSIATLPGYAKRRRAASIACASLAGSTGLVRCRSNPAARVRAMSCAAPQPVRAMIAMRSDP